MYVITLSQSKDKGIFPACYYFNVCSYIPFIVPLAKNEVGDNSVALIQGCRGFYFSHLVALTESVDLGIELVKFLCIALCNVRSCHGVSFGAYLGRSWPPFQMAA